MQHGVAQPPHARFPGRQLLRLLALLPHPLPILAVGEMHHQGHSLVESRLVVGDGLFGVGHRDGRYAPELDPVTSRQFLFDSPIKCRPIQFCEFDGAQRSWPAFGVELFDACGPPGVGHADELTEPCGRHDLIVPAVLDPQDHCPLRIDEHVHGPFRRSGITKHEQNAVFRLFSDFDGMLGVGLFQRVLNEPRQSQGRLEQVGRLRAADSPQLQVGREDAPLAAIAPLDQRLGGPTAGASQPTAGRNQYERFRTARQFVPADVERIDLPPNAEPAVELGELARSQERLRQPPGLGRPAYWNRFGGTPPRAATRGTALSTIRRRTQASNRLGSPEVRTQRRRIGHSPPSRRLTALLRASAASRQRTSSAGTRRPGRGGRRLRFRSHRLREIVGRFQRRQIDRIQIHVPGGFIPFRVE